MQIAALSSEISLRFAQRQLSDDDEFEMEGVKLSVNPYISEHVTWLISQQGTSKILRDFATSLAHSTGEAFQGTSLLAGYLLALLQSFPTNADEIRMRLFLEEIGTNSGNIPTVKFLWQMMKQTTVFDKLKRESETPTAVLQRYLQSSSQPASESTEDQEWRIVLLFLELYTFILRLSDDEDFFSSIQPQLLDGASSQSRIRSCSLSLEDIKSLSVLLKNSAFTLYYKSKELSQSSKEAEMSTKSRLDYYLGAGTSESQSRLPSGRDSSPASTKLSLESLRGIISSAVKMLYERDSRKPFLPAGHWLMPDKLQREDFVTAVIAEEERQREEELADSDDEMDTGEETLSPFETGLSYSFAGQRLSRHARMERLRAQQVRSQRERRLAEMGPKLEILKHMPFVVPFDTRVMIFRQFIQLDRDRRDGDSQVPIHLFARHNVNIRRGQLFDDAYDELYKIGDGLKDQIQVTFVDQFNTPEAGIDGGGVTKEFLTSVTSEAFGSKEGTLGMFTSSADGLLYPDPTSIDVLREQMKEQGISESSAEWREVLHEQLKRYEFLGRIVGKCLYEGILVDLAFAGFFLLKWPSSGPNEENSFKGGINDLRDMDEDLYKGMLRLKNYPGDVSDLGIDFTVEDQVSKPEAPVKTVTRKLVAVGDQIYVTNDNRLLYISYVARHRLVVQPSLQTTAFLRGLRAIIRPSWLSMFNQSELQRLVGGDSSEIDLEDLRQNTIYSGLYEIGDDNEEHPTIKLFWKVMHSFTDAQRRDLLKYVSSTPRAPLLGFSQLRPKFSIRDSGTDEERLPSTSTCVNLLKLPRYTKESTLREKLLYAITSGAGFDLS
jgi:ubiquitin-protein ligase E3 C